MTINFVKFESINYVLILIVKICWLWESVNTCLLDIMRSTMLYQQRMYKDVTIAKMLAFLTQRAYT